MIWKILCVMSMMLNVALLYGNIHLRRCVDRTFKLADDSFTDVISRFRAAHHVLEYQIDEYKRFEEESRIFWPGLAEWAARSMADNLKMAEKYRALFVDKK